MRKIALALGLAATLLAGCSLGGTGGAPPPATASTVPADVRCGAGATQDSQAICLAFHTFDALLSVVDTLREVGVLKPGTPKALAVAGAIKDVKVALNAASAIQKGVRTGDYSQAIKAALDALDRLKVVLH